MELTVETGKGLPGANSYISLAEALKNLPSAYIAEWNGLTPDERVDRLAAASLFIDTAFNWAGKQKTLEQGLSWPRTGVVFQGHAIDPDTVPRPLKRAVVAALVIIKENGPGVFISTGRPQVKREKMAVFETEYFEPGLKAGYKSAYEDINMLLKGLYAAPGKGGVISGDVIRV